MATLIENRTVVTFPARLDAFTTTALDQQQQRHISVVSSHNIPDDRRREQTDSVANHKTRSPVPTTQHALLVTQDRSYSLIFDFPVPSELGRHEVLIRNRAVGLNHIDWMSVEYNFCLPELPWITGRELAGIVECVGEDVTSLKAGDAVWTCKSPMLSFLVIAGSDKVVQQRTTRIGEPAAFRNWSLCRNTRLSRYPRT